MSVIVSEYGVYGVYVGRDAYGVYPMYFTFLFQGLQGLVPVPSRDLLMRMGLHTCCWMSHDRFSIRQNVSEPIDPGHRYWALAFYIRRCGCRFHSSDNTQFSHFQERVTENVDSWIRDTEFPE